MSEMQSISLRLEKEDYAAICSLAGQKQAEGGECYSVSEVIRDLLRQSIDKRDVPFIPVNKEYDPIGRRLLDTVYLESGEMAAWRRGVSAEGYVIPKYGSVPDMIVEHEDGSVKLETLAVNPCWRMDADIPEDENEVISRSIVSLNRLEDKMVFDALNCAFMDGQKNQPCWGSSDLVVNTDSLSLEDLNRAKNSITRRELDVFHVVCHTDNEDICSAWAKSYNTEYKKNVVVFSCTMCSKKSVYLLSDPKHVGKIYVKYDTTIVDDPRPHELRHGKVIWKRIGIAVANDYALSKIVIGEPEWKMTELISNPEEKKPEEFKEHESEKYYNYDKIMGALKMIESGNAGVGLAILRDYGISSSSLKEHISAYGVHDVTE